MLDLASFGSFLSGISAAFDSSTTAFRGKDKAACAVAIRAIQNGCNKTRLVIQQSGYNPDDLLSTLWLEAMEKTAAANLSHQLSMSLLKKSRFWANPWLWLSNPNSMTLVPTLLHLEEECEMILMQIGK